jgi:hypothetical protein
VALNIRELTNSLVFAVVALPVMALSGVMGSIHTLEHSSRSLQESGGFEDHPGRSFRRPFLPALLSGYECR